MQLPEYDAVVLAGGASSRFGSDKLAAMVDGVALLDRVLAAAVGARQRIVVGRTRPTQAHVVWTWEDPPGGGPAAGVVAGLALVTSPWVVLLAGDLPYVEPATLQRLVTAAGSPHEGALLVDAGGRRQHLCCAVAAKALRAQAATRPDWHGAPLRALLAGLALAEVPALAAEAHDVDIPRDLDPQETR
jgi:molybdopterin-guanine dinucleotide biosynthesis protein A